MIFFSLFKTLIDEEVTVELKNDMCIRGTLKSVDPYLNIKLDNITVTNDVEFPHLSAVKNTFIRGSVVRYVHLPPNKVDTALLQDASRRGGKYESGPAPQFKSANTDQGTFDTATTTNDDAEANKEAEK